MARKTTIRQEVLKADPAHTQWAKNPTEYDFSNGRVFRGYYSQRGAYNFLASILLESGTGGLIRNEEDEGTIALEEQS